VELFPGESFLQPFLQPLPMFGLIYFFLSEPIVE